MFKFLLLAICLSATSCQKDLSSPNEAIDSVVKLISDKGQCTGEEIIAPSGKQYVLTAAHCKELLANAQVTAITEQNKKLKLRLIAEDPNSDLMLLSADKLAKHALKIGKSEQPRQHIRTFTHGNNFPTYETDGVIIAAREVKIPIKALEPGQEEECSKMPKNKVENVMTFFGPMEACVMDVREIAITALIVPGSSGGPVVDDSGNLIGVVSASDDHFGWIVRLKDIIAFLKNR